MNVPHNPDNLEVAVSDDEVREYWYEYPIKVGETIATNPGYNGAGS